MVKQKAKGHNQGLRKQSSENLELCLNYKRKYELTGQMQKTRQVRTAAKAVAQKLSKVTKANDKSFFKHM